MDLRVSIMERRARLVARHHLGRTAPGVVDAVRGVVALHSSDPLTPHLALRARTPGFLTGHLDRALHEERSLWRMHAMRRTLFVVPADEAGVFQAGAARDVARRERRRIEGWLGAEMDPAAVRGWLARVESCVLEVLADGSERSTRELSVALPELRTEITVGSGRWTTRAPLSSRVLFLVALDGRIVRTRPAGSWRSSQYGWSSAAHWFEREPASLDVGAARAELARMYLHAFGPATLVDLRWWTGWTASQAGKAIRDVGAVAVTLEAAGEGLVLETDVDGMHGGDGAGGSDRPSGAKATAAPVVTLLPALDPTAMGWKERDWYLGDHARRLFDRNGNVGPTLWLDGRVIGGWGQRANGEVVCAVLDDVGSEIALRVEEEAAELGRWMEGAVAIPRFRTPLERELAG